MRQSIVTMVLQAAPLLLQASIATAQTAAGTGLKPVTTLSCYQSVDNLAEYQEYQYMTDGWCQEQCGSVLNKPVMAITGGSTCYCGDEIPASDQIVANSSCSSPCNGFGVKTCGGIGFWQVYLTGLTTNVGVVDNTTTSSSSSISASSSTTSASPSVITKAGETVVVTAASSPTASAQSTGSNKVGIAVGVVVGIIAIAGLVGALIFFLKQRRRRAIEDEHKRNAAINGFVAGKKSETSSNTDQRLDPVIFSHRRESIGSIADEMDYSRRILQVRNPDHRASQQSNLVP